MDVSRAVEAAEVLVQKRGEGTGPGVGQVEVGDMVLKLHLQNRCRAGQGASWCPHICFTITLAMDGWLHRR